MLANRNLVRFALPLSLMMAATGIPPALSRSVQATRLVPSLVKGSSQLHIESKVIEQRSRSGQILARLRVTPGTLPGEFKFEVQAFKQPAHAAGTGKVSEMKAEVQLVESRSGSRVGLRAETTQGTGADTRVTLSLDRLDFNFIRDEKVQALMNEVKRIGARGGDETELIPLARQIDAALRVKTGYRPFVEQVRGSAAFETLSALRSVMATVPREEVKRNQALAVLRDVGRFLVPSSPSVSSATVSSKLSNQDRIVRVASLSGRTLLSAQGGSNCGPNISCTDCFWDEVRNVCQPMQILLEILCDTMAFVEWLWCLP